MAPAASNIEIKKAPIPRWLIDSGDYSNDEEYYEPIYPLSDINWSEVRWNAADRRLAIRTMIEAQDILLVLACQLRRDALLYENPKISDWFDLASERAFDATGAMDDLVGELMDPTPNRPSR